MSDQNPRGSDQTAYQLIADLDALEELLELMDEVGVSTRAEVEARMEDLHRRIDELESA